MSENQKTYIAIDLKSFYASVECRELKKNPMEIVQDGSATRLLMEETKGGSGR